VIRALIVVAHPDRSSFNHAIANRLGDVWMGLGLSVSFRDLHSEGFDPVLTLEEQRGAPSSDPLVQSHIADLRSADLLAVVHPNCWGAPPAMMKGWIDRVFAPDAAYAFEKGTDGGDAPMGLLAIQQAIVINTGNTSPDRERDVFGDHLDAIWRACIVSYCGVKDVRRELFAIVATSSPQERSAWLNRTTDLARSAVAELSGLW
jgi:putative NADPH-quinone reductase